MSEGRDASPSGLERPWRGWGKRLRYALYVLLALAAAYELVRAVGHLGDLEAYLAFGEVVLQGRVPYDPAVEADHVFGRHWATWPPSFVALAVPLWLARELSHPVAAVGWQALNLAGLAVVLAWCARWLHGRGLSLRPGPGRIPLLALPMAVALFVPLKLVVENFEHGQVNLLVHGLAVGGLWLMARARRWWGGLAMALSVGIKATPVLFLPYLAWRGRWRDLGAVLGAGAVVWAGIPALAAGPAGALSWYGKWLGRTGDLEIWAYHSNQSLQAALGRWLHGAGPLAPPEASYGLEVAGPLLLGGERAAPWVMAAAVVAGGLALLAFGRPLRAVPRRREALEVGVVLTAIALFSPIAWTHHFVGLVALAGALFAFTPAARAWAAGTAPTRAAASVEAGGGRSFLGRGEARPVYAALALAFLLLNTSSTGMVGSEASHALEMAGVVTWPALAITLLALWVLWRTGRPRGRLAGEAGA